MDQVLRLMECLRLRVKDIDFSYSCIHIHDGKGAKDRIVTLPSQLNTVVANHFHHTQLMHRADLRKDLGEVYLPYSSNTNGSRKNTFTEIGVAAPS